MAKKMSRLDLCWKNCMSLWRWVAKMKLAGDVREVDELKEIWIDKHGFSNIIKNCFFCDFCGENCDTGDSGCPGQLIDSSWGCCDSGTHFEQEPIAFYNGLRRLNCKRLKGKL